MCLGGKKSAPPPVPAPAQPTKFEYVNADQSNTQQRAAAINSATTDQTTAAGFGSELGSGGALPTQVGGVT